MVWNPHGINLFHLTATEGRVEVRADLLGDQRDDRPMESAVSRLGLEPSVTRVRWQIRSNRPGEMGADA